MRRTGGLVDLPTSCIMTEYASKNIIGKSRSDLWSEMKSSAFYHCPSKASRDTFRESCINGRKMPGWAHDAIDEEGDGGVILTEKWVQRQGLAWTRSIENRLSWRVIRGSGIWIEERRSWWRRRRLVLIGQKDGTERQYRVPIERTQVHRGGSRTAGSVR